MFPSCSRGQWKCRELSSISGYAVDFLSVNLGTSLTYGPLFLCRTSHHKCCQRSSWLLVLCKIVIPLCTAIDFPNLSSPSFTSLTKWSQSAFISNSLSPSLPVRPLLLSPFYPPSFSLSLTLKSRPWRQCSLYVTLTFHLPYNL